MKIERFEDIEAWQLARELARKVYHLLRFTVHGSGLEGYEIGIEPLFHQFNREA